jgi:uncharacterized protein YggE
MTAYRIMMMAIVVGLVQPALAPLALRASETPPATISVSGSAEVKVPPDEINLDVGVEVRNPHLDQAKAQNDEKVASVLKFLKNSGIDSKDVQTDFVGIHPEFKNERDTIPEIYVVQRSIGIRLRKVSDFEKVLTGVLKNGVNYVHGIDFRTTELRKHRDTARQMAIRAAREKADALAGELGVKVGKVQSISENTWGGWWSWSGGSWGSRRYGGMYQNVMQNAGGSGPSEDGSLSVGQISVSATVNVSFALE